ncbi:MAG: thiosulfate oxidation carrier protein SoxY [Sulfurovum sp.]|nr:thiosulfate oxidation carrier protein SoxY [Sulfurovum sp.]MCB4744169.1 thiosulfate oxidation carrier protein SoxY [Sulfurovum sp.]MCB4746384.1 thiosulfate oxidation carrier protein SoxY [Sulfurovum sp.]MCB4749171.1 thiosulfate oxidation carrier protein SoxY [Sulfurovum sp.]MCB4750053.1 thiosulfate oxidation carrier protein SoxY [Sulfurovum sp.]
MNRRNFIGFGVLAMATLPVAASAATSIDFRKVKPDTWTAKTVEDAIKALYGEIKPKESGVKVKAPKVASNGGAVPITIKTDIPAKTVALFQNMDPESTVAVWNIPENAVINYSVKIKLKATDENGGNGVVTVIVEGKDGKFYKGTVALKVAKGGCEG